MSELAEQLTHFDAAGRARMVDISDKGETDRLAVALARVRMKRDTAQAIADGKLKKGDVLAVAQIAAIMAAKRTSELIPMCHPLPLTRVDAQFDLDVACGQLDILVTVGTVGKTGVEMEALTAASTAALTVYDMCKAIDREMEIAKVCLLHKRGGKSGDFTREEL